MLKQRKYIISWLLALILIMPTVVKLEHHHDHEYHHEAEDATDYHFSHKCIICDFQYSAFIFSELSGETAEMPYYSFLTVASAQFIPSNSFKYSSLLRAPPVLQSA